MRALIVCGLLLFDGFLLCVAFGPHAEGGYSVFSSFALVRRTEDLPPGTCLLLAESAFVT